MGLSIQRWRLQGKSSSAKNRIEEIVTIILPIEPLSDYNLWNFLELPYFQHYGWAAVSGFSQRSASGTVSSQIARQARGGMQRVVLAVNNNITNIVQLEDWIQLAKTRVSLYDKVLKMAHVYISIRRHTDRSSVSQKIIRTHGQVSRKLQCHESKQWFRIRTLAFGLLWRGRMLRKNNPSVSSITQHFSL